ncbi:AlpA family phage regulatory protein [Bradyrhizobium centrolobii]
MERADTPDRASAVRQMISIRDVLRRVPISRSTLERKVKEGTFPKMYSIAPMRVGFFLDEVLQWQADLIQNEIRPAEPLRVLVRGRS